MAISQETVEEVLRVSNVYDVISEYINLEKTGSNYRALCPFHSEKTPSFMVSPQKNIYKCFGCGKSGNALTFIMDYEGLSFKDAVIKLAEKYNIPVKYTKEDEKREEKNRLFSTAEKIKNFYKESLKNSQSAKQYIKERGIKPSSVDFFDIGYSPVESEKLLEFIKKENISVDDLKSIGLVSIREDGKIVDKFSGRVIFPIKDPKGKVVGFGGRSIDNRQPKYINSPETDIYSKGKILYGYFEAKDALREKKEAIIVEGYLDLISLFQIGFKNVVATLGTALTEHHGRLLSKFVKKVILMFDSDSAGKKAAVRAAKVLLPYRIDVFYCLLEKGSDPDDIAKKGYKEVEKHIERSQDFLIFLLDRLQQQKDLKKRKEIIDLYLDILSYMPDKHSRGVYIKELSERTGIPAELLVVEDKQIKIEEEEKSDIDNLYMTEKIVLKGVVEFKDELLSRFDKFDKITGSVYFLYILNEILSGREIEELEKIKKLDIPVSMETVLNALNILHQKWIEQQNQINAIFSSENEEIISKIFTNKKSLYTRRK